MSEFEQLQIAGMQPSLLVNRLGISPATWARIFSKIKLHENGCWEWTGAKTKGYGMVKIHAIRSTPIQVHRLCYETVHGPMPDGFQSHHKVEDGCMGPACCNPSHILPATPGQHTTELTPTGIAYINSHSDCCAAGHPYTLESLRFSRGVRQCRICDKIKAQDSRDRKRGDREKFKRDPSSYSNFCLRGHDLTLEENVSIIETKWGSVRRCRLCEKIRLDERKKAGTVTAPTQTHCKNGHLLSADNLFERPGGFMGCKQCRSDRVGAYNKRNREKINARRRAS